jgi:hypothetical protein
MEKFKHDGSCIEARIIGRTLKLSLDKLNEKHRFGKVKFKQLIHICPICDASVLRLQSDIRLPFTCEDNVMRTTADVNDSLEFESLDLVFCDFIFSKSALENAIALIQKEDKTTKDVEKLGIELKNNLNPVTSLQFTKEVCKWGRGQRVFANLIRRNKSKNLGVFSNKYRGSCGNYINRLHEY